MRQEKGKDHYLFFSWLLCCYGRMFFNAIEKEITSMPLNDTTLLYFEHLMNQGYARQIRHIAFLNGADTFVDYALEHMPLVFINNLRASAIKYIGDQSKEETFFKLAKAIIKSQQDSDEYSIVANELHRYMVFSSPYISSKTDWIREGLPAKYLLPGWYGFKNTKDLILKSYEQEKLLESMK